MANVGDQDNEVPPQDNHVPPPEEVVMGDQDPNVPEPMNDRDIWASFLTLTQAMNSQANAISSQV